MSNFVPDDGTYFYVSVRPYQVIDRVFGDVETKTRTVVDRSYADSIFVCTGSDKTAVVCRRVVGGYGGENRPYIFRIDQIEFQPVGPEVVSALGIGA